MYTPREGDKNIVREAADIVGSGIEAADKYVWTPVADAAGRAAASAGEVIAESFAESFADAVSAKASETIEHAITKGLERCFGSTTEDE